MRILGILAPFVLIALAVVVVVLTKRAKATANSTATTNVPAAPVRRRRRGWLVWVVVALMAFWIYGLYRSSKTPTSRLRPAQQATVVTQYDSLINETAGRYGVDANLVKAVIQHESGFNPQAVGPKGEKGLMQLMPDTITRYGVSDPFDPRQNIDGGSHYLADLLKKYGGNTEAALAAYNAGEETVDKGQVPDSTRNVYVPAVMALYKGGVSLPTTAAPAIPVSPAPAVVAATTTEVVAKPNQWSENVSVPSDVVARLEPKGKVRYRFWDGREIDDEPGKDNWLKDCIRNGNFRVRSREDDDVRVVVNIGPK